MSAKSYCAFSSGPGSLPWRSSSRTFEPTLIAQSKMAFFRPPAFSAFWMAAPWIFSKIRGTDGK